MSFDLGSTGELNALAEAIGLVDAQGNLDSGWFANPLQRLEHMLTADAQRQALEHFLDLVVPPTAEPGRPASEKWHPVLGPQPNGNVFFTVRDTGSGLALGVAGEIHTSTSPIPARLRVQADAITAGSSVALVVGTTQHPLVVEVRVEPGWTVAGGHPIGLQAIAATISIVPDPTSPSVDLKLVLEQLQVDAAPAADKVLDAADLGADIPDVLVSLIRAALHEAGADPTLAGDLLPLLGLDPAGTIPAFPIAQLSQGPAALQQWIAQLCGLSGAPASATAWLTHLAKLLGQTVVPTGSGTGDDPWIAPVFALPGGGAVNVELSLVDGHLRVGVSISMTAPLGAGEPTIGLVAGASLADIPLNGTAHARVLPSIDAVVQVRGDTGQLVNNATISIDHAQFGIRWDGSALHPLLELITVTFGGTSYPKLDLTNVQSVESAAASAVVTAITNALGVASGVGRHLAAIAGLVAPGDPANPGSPLPGWTHQLDLGVLVAHPTRAIADYHLAVLADGAAWASMFAELAGLLGISATVSGAGTVDSPWVVDLPGAGPNLPQLAAWHSAASSGQQLRVGLRWGIADGATSFAWLAEVLAFDLNSGGVGAVRLLGKQSLALTISPALATAIGPVDVAVASLRAGADWTPGQPLTLGVHAQGFALTVSGQTVTIADLQLPPAGGFDLTNLSASAAALGITVTVLEDVVRLVLTLIASIAGPEEQVLAALLGLETGLPGLSADLPSIADPANPGLVLTNPLGALQGWLARVIVHVSAAGDAGLVGLLRWLAALAEDAVADLVGDLPTDLFDGAGTFARPWRMAWPGAGTTRPELELWLEPAGPPAAWVTGLATRAAAAKGYGELADIVAELSWHDDDLASLVDGLSARGLTERMRGLATYFNSTDGVVPRDSQAPDIFGWANNVNVDAAHQLAPTHPDAITEILTQIESLLDGAARTVLLIGPSFSDHSVWNGVLTSPQRQGTTDPGAHFDLRTPGIDPTTITLASVTAVADYYTADLVDDRSGNVDHLVEQIAHVADRIAELHPGPLTIVTHSYAALAARSYAALHADRVQSLITVAAPHIGAPLALLNDVELGDAVRVASVLRPTMAASPARDAIDHLMLALEGYLPPAAGGTLAIPDPYPATSFGMAAPFDLGTIPVVTIGAVLCDDMLEWWRAALIAHINHVAGLPSPTPTHLAYGMSMPLALGSGIPGVPDVGARVRHALGRVALGHGGAALPRPAQLMRVEVDLFAQDGWVVGGPAATDPDGRLRRLQIGVTAQRGATGPQTSVDATLSQGAWHGLTTPSGAITDPMASSLIGAAFAAVLAANDTADGTISAPAAALAAIDLLTTDATGATGLSADGFATLRSDPLGYLGTRIPNALANGWLRFVKPDPTKTEYTYTPGGSAYSLFVNKQGAAWHTGVRTAAADPGAVLNIGVDVDVSTQDFHSAVDLFATLGIATATWHSDTGAITVDAPPLLNGLAVWPTPSPADLAAQLNVAVPHLLATGALSVVLSEFSPGLQVGQLLRLLAAPGEFLVGTLGQTGGGFDPARLASLIESIGTAIGLPGPGLTLPGGLALSAGPGTAAGHSQLAIATTAPIAGVLGVDLFVDIDTSRHPTPGGTVSVTTPLSGSWPEITITFGVGPSGVTLVVTPQGVPPITLLPTFSGLGSLQGAAAALLPAALDAFVGAYPTPPPAWLQNVLDVASALSLHSAGGFAPNTPTFTALLGGHLGTMLDAAHRTTAATAVVSLLNSIPGMPGTLSPTDGVVQWSYPLPAGQGTISVAAGYGANGATAQVGIVDLKPTGAPVDLSASARIDHNGVDLRASLGADLSALGITKVPRLSVDINPADPAHVRVQFKPLSDTTDGPLVIDLAPTFGVTQGAGFAEGLLFGWALPLAIGVAVKAADTVLDRPIHSGSTMTVRQLLVTAGILDSSGNVKHLAPADAFEVLGQFLLNAASGLGISLGELQLSLYDQSNLAGIEIKGKQDIPLGDLTLSIVFGAPSAWGATASQGLVVTMLDTSSSTPAFDFQVLMHGVGFAFSKSDGTPLVAETYLRLGSVSALLSMDIKTHSGLQVTNVGAGVALGGFGLPISAALGAGGGSNPVASNILGSGGSGSGGSQPVNPSTEVDVWWDGSIHVLVGGTNQMLWIPVHAQFGPIFIGELGVGVSQTDLSMGIDGGVSIAGLSAEVDQLTIGIPFQHVTDPKQWSIDLRGLAVGYSNAGVSIAGGLVKFDGPPIEYDGMLMIKIENIGAIVIGSYSVVGSGADQYTSLAIFGGVFVPIGIPPIINLTGFALGLGYNRRLIVPEDLNQIPSFMLVEALDKPEALANNPMQALFAFRDEVPPERGALWLAAGLRGTAFEIVNITAVVYVAIDNGVDVGILGVARMALPTDDAAIVSIELALKARFSSAEGLFSVQAQLTDNSWLISRDCQLTGGFAFFMWFKQSQFLLTLGGYHPAFKPLPEYPVVPRLGYHWNFAGVVQIKGESYFALTNTCVMAGVRTEATYGPDWLQLWFTAYADILIAWDPFHYDVRAGVAVGARLRIHVCFFACVTIEISVSVGADLILQGPPFHGTVTADLGVCTVTVPFGDDALPAPPPKSWSEFVSKYVTSGDDNGQPVSAQVAKGLLPAEPAGAPVAPGTDAQPWRLAAEWSFLTQTRMPTRGYTLQDGPADPGGSAFGVHDNLSGTYAFDIAPMYVAAGHLTTMHSVTIRWWNGNTFVDMVPTSAGASPSPDLVLSENQFTVTPQIVQVSEATYHYFPDLKPPAAANTLPALGGLRIDGFAMTYDESARVPIGTLVDATNPRPLPFAVRRLFGVIGEILAAGTAWQDLAALADGSSSAALIDAAHAILGGLGPEFAALRADAGLPRPGYGPVALSSLATRRSAPPVLSALSEGFTLTAPGIGVPPAMPVRPTPAGVVLTAPRLRAAMQRGVLPAGTTTIVTTSVPMEFRSARVIDVRTALLTSWTTTGFALIKRSTDLATQPTRLARSARTLRNVALGGPTGRATVMAMEEMSAEVTGNGVPVRAGSTHVWELPGTPGWSLDITGAGAVRVTELTTAGTALVDREYPQAPGRLTVGADCAMVAVTALGISDLAGTAAGLPGAVTGRAAARSEAMLGWQIEGDGIQVGPTTILTRASVLSLSAVVGSWVRGHQHAVGVLPLARALAQQQVANTEFPAGVTMVGVLVDRPDGGVVNPDTVQVNTDGATVSARPVQVVAGNRTLFLYDLAPSGEATTVSIAVGLAEGLTLSGVVAARGTASAWAQSVAGTTLQQLVPSEHLSQDGVVTVRLSQEGTDG